MSEDPNRGTSASQFAQTHAFMNASSPFLCPKQFRSFSMPSHLLRTSLAPLCLGILVACGSNDGRQADATESIELSAVIQSLGPLPVESVEYSVRCLDDEGSSVPDQFELDGALEPPNSRVVKTGMLDTLRETWTGFMDLPPGSCWMQVRGRDGDGEVICTADVPFSVVAGNATQVVVPLACSSPGYPKTPPGSFNLCPDLRALSCDELDPVEGSTSCVVSFLDYDNTCDRGCDPQTCVADGTVGLMCAPGPDPGVSTTINCTNAVLDCTGDGAPDASCTFNSATPGARLGTDDTLIANFFVECIPPASGGMPGATITCTAVTSDGDLDCDMSRAVTVDCPDPKL